MVRLATASLPLLAASCIVSEGSLSISTAQLDEEALEALVMVDVVVLGGALPDGRPLECAPFQSGELSLDDEALDVVYRTTIEHDASAGGAVGPEPPPVGHLGAGRYLFHAVGWDGSCRVLAVGCLVVLVGSGRDRPLLVDLEPVEEPEVACAPGQACVDRRCGPCQRDDQCDDRDPCTVDRCSGGECTTTPAVPDLDRDGHGNAACPSGDDCDDDDPTVFPGAPRRCGRGVDHDCDGVVDDGQGCEPCEGAAGLRRLGSIATRVSGLTVLGPAPGVEPRWELFVATAGGALEVSSVDATGAASSPRSSDFFGAEPLAPQVVSDHALVADRGGAGLGLYRTEDLRQGGAAPIARAAAGAGEVGAFLAGSRAGWICLATDGGLLSRVDLSALPELPEPERVSDDGRWLRCEGLAREGAGLLGASGTLVGWAELGAGDEVLGTGVVDLTHALSPLRPGAGSAVALLPGLALLARGAAGLLLLGRDGLGEGAACCEASALALPEGCSGAACHEALEVAALGSSRALVLARPQSPTERPSAFLVDVASPESPTLLATVDVLEPGLEPRALVVSGSLAFFAGADGPGEHGAIDVVEILCE